MSGGEGRREEGRGGVRAQISDTNIDPSKISYVLKIELTSRQT